MGRAAPRRCFRIYSAAGVSSAGASLASAGAPVSGAGVAVAWAASSYCRWASQASAMSIMAS